MNGNELGCSDATDGIPSTSTSQVSGICNKCKEQEAKVRVGQGNTLCLDCLHDHVLGKVRFALRSKQIIRIGDSVAAAFSGGTSSACLVHNLTSIRSSRTDRPERQKIAFGLNIIYIEEGAVRGLDIEQTSQHTEDTASCVTSYCSEDVTFKSYPLEDIFADELEDPNTRRQRLISLVEAVSDPTGRDDLITYLRNLLLVRVAHQSGCRQILTGHTGTALAAHSISEATKGRGYGVTGDVQLVDARYGADHPLFAHPMREVSQQEAQVVCDFKQLKTVDVSVDDTAKRGGENNINSLAEGFIGTLQNFNPGAVNNIMSTMAKLQAFAWNESNVSRRKEDENKVIEPHSDLMCPLCSAPLAEADLDLLQGGGQQESALRVCWSCSSQIFGSDEAKAAEIAGMLPLAVREGMHNLKAEQQ